MASSTRRSKPSPMCRAKRKSTPSAHFQPREHGQSEDVQQQAAPDNPDKLRTRKDSPHRPAASRPGSVRREPLPIDGFQARFAYPDFPESLWPGAVITINARVSNMSPTPWPAVGAVDGRYRIGLRYRWLRTEDRSQEYIDDNRTWLRSRRAAWLKPERSDPSFCFRQA
jgi:hypothetical protein